MTLRRAAALALCAVLLVACGEDDEPLIDVAAAPYTVTLPTGWTEGTDQEKKNLGLQAGTALENASGAEIDLPGVGITSLWLRGEATSDSPFVAIFREPIAAGLSPSDFVSTSVRNAMKAFSEQIVEPPVARAEVAVAGEPAQVFDYSLKVAGRTLAKRAVFILRNEVAYTLTLTSPPPEFDVAAAELDEILASWNWT